MADESVAPAGAGAGAPRRPGLSFALLLRAGAAALGIAALVAGCVSAFVLRSDTAAVAVLVAGAALVIVVLVLPRLSELNVGTDGVSLKLTMEAAATGAPTAAGVMENSGLARFAIAYEIVHSELRGNPEYESARVHLQDVLVERASAMAFGSTIPAAEVRALFIGGSPVLRTLSIGFMKGDPSTADTGLLASAITAPASANEQYQALDLVEQLWARWSREEREYLRSRIRATDFQPGTSRSRLAARILDLPVEPRLPQR
ncbi:hypothetical protein ACQPZA_25265 [Pseudonocardia xinjiangensis]|uniref:hypothetical protein n=1 Tax=Pseudonocardia xinjiangensis TaxID=75289 RepID=UPI003D8FC891